MTVKPFGNHELIDVDLVTAADDGADDRSTALVPLAQAKSGSGIKQPQLAISPGKLREALFFRWKSALVIGLLFAAVGAGIAWFTYKPKYTAVAMMRLASTKPRLLPGSEDANSVRPEEFQKTEAQMIKSR